MGEVNGHSLPTVRVGDHAGFEWASIGRAKPGESVSGDLAAIISTPRGMLFGLIDGLGHGPDAATAAMLARSCLEQHAGAPLPILMQRCHRSLTDTRGAALTLVELDARSGDLAWLAVGNVRASVVSASAAGSQPRSEVLQRAGIVGYRLPAALDVTLAHLATNELLVMATDGLAGNLSGSELPMTSPSDYAAGVVRNRLRDNDDALVLALRRRSPSTIETP